MVFYLLNEYAHEATGVYGKILHMELADLGTLQTARLAHDLLGWHFGYEELVVVAMDLDNVGRAAFAGNRGTPQDDIERYLGKRMYDIHYDIRLVETSMQMDIVENFRQSKTTAALGNRMRN